MNTFQIMDLIMMTQIVGVTLLVLFAIVLALRFLIQWPFTRKRAYNKSQHKNDNKKPGRKKRETHSLPLSEDVVREIKRDLSKGYKVGEVARRNQVNAKTVSNIKYKLSYKKVGNDL